METFDRARLDTFFGRIVREFTPAQRPTSVLVTHLLPDGHLAPRLRTPHTDVIDHLDAHPGEYDVLYSVFGGFDFADPRRLLPAAARALRPGGLLAASTLGHYVGGAPAEPDVRHADIPARTPDGTATTMRRWVLQEHVWTKLLDEAGFTGISIERLPPANSGARSADTLLVRAHRHR
ncbi:hypothetical protein ACFRAR_15680 [Kitasatospora sp. NPDC056651]|uniref:hypothetical protein n=1 Tax=Kitasatospora sp. NPDC056651 TaxID=3345892 RepID=UPI0036B47529